MHRGLIVNLSIFDVWSIPMSLDCYMVLKFSTILIQKPKAVMSVLYQIFVVASEMHWCNNLVIIHSYIVNIKYIYFHRLLKHR